MSNYIDRKSRRCEARMSKIYMYDAETYEYLDTYDAVCEAEEDNDISKGTLVQVTRIYPNGYEMYGAIYSRVNHGARVNPELVAFKRHKYRLTDEEKAIIDAHSHMPYSRVANMIDRDTSCVRSYIKRCIKIAESMV